MAPSDAGRQEDAGTEADRPHGEPLLLACPDLLLHVVDDTIVAAGGAPPSLGAEAASLAGRRLVDLAHPDDVEPLRRWLATGAPRWLRVRLQGATGLWCPFDAMAGAEVAADPGGRVLSLREAVAGAAPTGAGPAAGSSEVVRDVPVPGGGSYLGVLEASPEALVVHAAGRVAFANGAAARLVGAASPADLVGREIVDFFAPMDRATVAERAARSYAGDVLTAERYLLVRLDGDVVEVEITSLPVADRDQQASLALVRDVSDVARAQRELTHQALHDALTGLANRSLLSDRLTVALARAERSGQRPAVLFADLDRFKRVNDSLGHEAGDRLLVVVADRLRRAVRPEDTVARLGGDEFVVVTDHVEDARDALVIGERVRQAVTRPVRLDEAELLPTLSIGVALAGPGDDATRLLRDADAAMYRAKQLGRDRVEVFGADQRAGALRRVGLEGDLRRALGAGELALAYQPIVHLDTRAVVGVEALLRWPRPEGEVPPAEFLLAAEDSSLIVAIGDWVLARALGDAGGWVEAGRVAPDRFRLHVNVSPRQLLQPGLADRVADALRAGGGRVPASALVLEFPEEALTGEPELVSAVLATLGDVGVRLAVDDFGSGTSSLARLARLPLDEIRIDATLVAGVASEPADRSVVGAIVDLAGALGLTVSGEGVETDDQEEALLALGCHVVQGFRYGRPEPADRVAARFGPDG